MTWWPVLKIFPQLQSDTACPDYCFYLAETLLVIDHQTKHTRIQASLFTPLESEKQRLEQRLSQLRQQLNEPPAPLPVTTVAEMRCDVDQSDEEYGAVVRKMQRAIRAGEIFQVVPSRRFSLPCPSPLAAYDVLKKSNPSPYMFFMQDNDFTLFGASPESSLKYDAVSRQIGDLTPSPAPGHAAAAPTARWIATSTAASSWKCAPIIKSFPNT